jgi:type III secretory pathway component EscS
LLALLSVGAIAGSRAIGLFIDGAFTDVLKGTIAFEITLFVISLVLFLRTPDAASAAALKAA